MLFPAACFTSRPARRRPGAGANCRIALGAAAVTLLAAAPAPAFFQTTNLEGPIGADIGGVWLSMQNVVPEFRVSYQKPTSGRAVPFTVGPIPAELEPVLGKNAPGVVITACDGGTFCAEHGLVAGDVVTKINTAELTDTASFDKAVENVPQTVFLTIRRAALHMTSARLFKFKYENKPQETGESTEVQESLDIQVLDVVLPFADKLEESRQKHTRFEPSAGELEDLKAKWVTLPVNQPARYVSGENRFVAKSHFDQALESDKFLTKAKFALILNMQGNPMQGGGKAIDVYGIESLTDSRMEGTFVTVTMASAPFPINIEFKGRFVATKVAPWSDEDDKIRAEKSKNKTPKEDLSKFKTLPDVPAPAKPADPPADKPAETK